jgi:hypothetical protein
MGGVAGFQFARRTLGDLTCTMRSTKAAEPRVTVGLFGNFVGRFSIVRAFEDDDVFLEPSYPSFDDT